MPFCPDCGTEVSEDIRFCPECGRPLATGEAVKGKSKKKIAGTIVAGIVAIILVIVLTRSPSSPIMEAPALEEGWVRLRIADVGSIDYPPDFLELQSGDYRELVEELYIVCELRLSDFALQQVGLNEMELSALDEFRRVVFQTFYLSRGEEVWRAKQKYVVSQQELSDFHAELVNERRQQHAALKSMGLGDIRILDSGSLQVLEVNGMFPLVWTYTRQLNDNPVVLVTEYMFPNYNKTHRLSFEYRVVDAEECGDIYEKILCSFRLE